MLFKFSMRQKKSTPYWRKTNSVSQSTYISPESKQNKKRQHIFSGFLSDSWQPWPSKLLAPGCPTGNVCPALTTLLKMRSWGSCGSEAACQRDTLGVKAPSGVRGMTMIIMFHKGLLSSFSASKWQSTETSEWRNPQNENLHFLLSF